MDLKSSIFQPEEVVFNKLFFYQIIFAHWDYILLLSHTHHIPIFEYIIELFSKRFN